MKSNVGGIDRILRIVVGLVLLGLTLTGTIGVWGWLGVVLLATGLIGLRFVTHLDVDEAGIDHALACIHRFFSEQLGGAPHAQAAGPAVY